MRGRRRWSPDVSTATIASMPRRRKFIWVVGAVVVLALGWLIFRASEEPSFEGKTLSQWIDTYHQGGTGWEQADAAVGKMSSKAIPFLLDWHSYERPTLGRWTQWVNGLLQKVNPRWFINDRSLAPNEQEVAAKLRRCECAHVALIRLGPMAFPELTRVATTARSRAVRARAMAALSSIRPGGFYVLVCALTNRPAPDLNEVRSYIWQFKELPVLPIMVQWLNDDDERVVLAAIRAIPGLPVKPETAWSALVRCRTDRRPRVRLSAVTNLQMLERFHPELTNSTSAR